MKTFQEIREGKFQSRRPSSKEVKMAIGIANDRRYKQGNMTGAVKAIEKIRDGLSDYPEVAAALKKANENVEEGKAYGPTGIAYSVKKGHPDEVDPRTKKKYPDRQTAKYKKQWAKSNKEEVEEDAPANSVAGGGVDLTPGIKRTDNRHKYSIGKMFRRNNGVK